jgi:hypothetical protein
MTWKSWAAGWGPVVPFWRLFAGREGDERIMVEERGSCSRRAPMWIWPVLVVMWKLERLDSAVGGKGGVGGGVTLCRLPTLCWRRKGKAEGGE